MAFKPSQVVISQLSAGCEMKIKKDSDIYEVIKKASKKVAKWPKWKRNIRVTKFSTGFDK